MSIRTFRETIERHGAGAALLKTFNDLLRRVVAFEICRVECDTGQVYEWPDVQGYETRAVTGDEFHARLCAELRHVDYRWSFARGDTCIASFRGDEIVGFSFYSRQPTRVRDGLVFRFPPSYLYAFASLTAHSHRGRRLEQDRWKIAQRIRIARQDNARNIWYVNVANLASRATSKAVGASNELLGYTAWITLGGRCFVYDSPGCRRAGAGFAPDAGAPQPDDSVRH